MVQLLFSIFLKADSVQRAAEVNPLPAIPSALSC